MTEEEANLLLRSVLEENAGLAGVHSPETTVVKFATPERVESNMRLGGGGKLEYWPQDEPGIPGFEHPTRGGKTVLEIYEPTLMSDPEELKSAIRGDLMHGLNNDPYFSDLKNIFKKSYTPETLKFESSKGRIGNTESVHDMYIRGYLNPDKDDEFRRSHQESGNVYSKEQLDVMKMMEDYIKYGKKVKY